MTGDRRKLADALLIARWILPFVIFAFVAAQQLLQWRLADQLDPVLIFVSNLLIYGITGPVAIWWALTVVARDLSGRESADEAALRREQYLASITRESADAILSLDTSGIIQSWSRGAQQMFGYSSEEIIGRHFGIIVPDDLKANGEIERFARMVEQQGYIRNYETERITKDGQRLSVDVTRTLIADNAGRVLGFSAIIRDVTERKKDEMEIRQLNRELEQRVDERTRELASAYDELRLRNEELEQANRELKELDRLKSDFISMVSHELRAPLTNINGALELMSSECTGAPGASCRSMLGIINDQAARLTRFVQSVLNVSRIEAGALALQFATVDVWAVIGKVVGDFAAHSLPQRLTMAGDPPPAPAWADRDRLAEILTNLIDNAVKYSPPGGDITISARQIYSPIAGADAEAGGRPFIVITVADTGIGIAPAEQERIFEQFYRVDRHDSREVYGHGLGLYIARRLVEDQGGRIWVDSAPGQGSRFLFSLPVASVSTVSIPQDTEGQT